MINEDELSGDLKAIAIGCVLGSLGGAWIGSCIVVLLGGFSSDMWIFVMLHSVIAMTVMGGWTAPSLLHRE